ncbi:hypothetical protein FACS1894120_4500 [Clostridia bacterium]|nr:hypothetical protein FACS1894120_4500 [Clostridia bacterium]
MFKFKKIAAMAVALMMVSAFTMGVSAEEVEDNTSVGYVNEDCATVVPLQAIDTGISVSDSADVATLADEMGFAIVGESGEQLEQIIVTYVPFGDEDCVESQNQGVSTIALGDSYQNVSRKRTDVYFSSSPISSDWYDGPLSSVSMTFSESVSATVNCSLEYSTSGLKSAVGFSVTDSVSKSKTATRSAISSTQRLNIKVYGVYDEYGFDIYSLLGNYKGSGYAYKPMGLYIAQAIYSK